MAGILDKKIKKYKPKEENVRKLMAFLEREGYTLKEDKDGGRRFKNTKQ